MFDIHQKVCDEDDELDDKLVGKYIDGLMAAFAESPEAQPILEQAGDVGWAETFLDFYFREIDSDYANLSLSDFEEIVFELFPRKLSTEAENAGPIIAELATFFAFLHRQSGLKSAAKILASLSEQSVVRLEKELADPSNYGMAKTIFMDGMAAGYDMTTQKGTDAYMRDHGPVLMDGPGPFPEEMAEDDDWDDEPPSLPAPPTPSQRAKKRKDRKRQRQARKRNRK
jgi:hypothetical protein